MASNTKARRFASFSEEDLKEIVNNSEAENTKKLTRIAVNVFREYLLSKQISAEFEGLSCEELDRSNSFTNTQQSPWRKIHLPCHQNLSTCILNFDGHLIQIIL